MKKKLNIPKQQNIIGSLLMLESLFMLIPLIITILYRESDWLAFAISIAATASVGFYMSQRRVESSILGKRDGFLLTVATWLSFCLFGMLPFLLCNNSLDFSSAFFEAASGFTTTGATTIANSASTMSHGIIIWQAIMQWLGGMGIIVFTLAIVPALSSSGGVQMFNAEVTGVTRDKLRPRIHQTAMALWGIYFVLTLILIGLLCLGGLDPFDAVCHAFGTISTGGFTSTEFTSDYIMIVTTIFMFLGGVNFAMIFRLVLLRWKPILADTAIKVYISIVLLFTLFIALSNLLTGDVSSWRDLTIMPLFHVVSIITSTGYIAPGFNYAGTFVILLTIIMMFSGGCAGSTSGGAKIDRLIYLQKYLAIELRRCLHPNAIIAVRINGKGVSPDLVNKTIAFLLLYVLLILGGAMLLSLFGMSAETSFFSALSCMCNTGLGAHYADVPSISKWILSFLMIAGRLEIYSILILFTRHFWRK